MLTGIPLMKRTSLFILAILCYATTYAQHSKLIDPKGQTIQKRILLPQGFNRLACKEGSFGAYVQNTPLLPDGSQVHYFNGKVKSGDGIYVAVVNMDIGNKDLQQCADVIMHVRAEYLYKTNQKDKIKFKLTNGFEVGYAKWMQGYRVAIKGNSATWVKSAAPADNVKTFEAYMDLIYTYCGTLSLSRELKKIKYADLQPGDLLIKGGSPGHAELVMDVAQDKNGNKIYLLAQSYMPAQQMQILANPENKSFSPWYELKGDTIITPEWDFTSEQVMRFAD